MIWFDLEGRMGENSGLCQIHELEADYVGLMITAEAGFDLQLMLDFMAIGVGKEEQF
jgi:hypothetical protein